MCVYFVALFFHKAHAIGNTLIYKDNSLFCNLNKSYEYRKILLMNRLYARVVVMLEVGKENVVLTCTKRKYGSA
ncbi:hypothetical protein AT237_01485 [Bartonella henselae]|nr:hypothetical protein AT237_01485 [Bartonella henselae]OLL42232.1 hypothetical protein AT244_02915 [Bartonella henselae]OLL42924.1 hypothetical protein AT245_03340 [Bartonella henselae]